MLIYYDSSSIELSFSDHSGPSGIKELVSLWE